MSLCRGNKKIGKGVTLPMPCVVSLIVAFIAIVATTVGILKSSEPSSVLFAGKSTVAEEKTEGSNYRILEGWRTLIGGIVKDPISETRYGIFALNGDATDVSSYRIVTIGTSWHAHFRENPVTKKFEFKAEEREPLQGQILYFAKVLKPDEQ